MSKNNHDSFFLPYYPALPNDSESIQYQQDQNVYSQEIIFTISIQRGGKKITVYSGISWNAQGWTGHTHRLTKCRQAQTGKCSLATNNTVNPSLVAFGVSDYP